MATLNARDVFILEQPPERNLKYKDLCIKSKVFRLFEDGAAWCISESRWRIPDIDKDEYRIHHFGGYTLKLHRLMLTVFDRPATTGEQCRHIDGDPSNNHIKNLKWGSYKENWNDRKLHGRIGAEWRRLLTKEQALEVFNDPKSSKELALIYNVPKGVIDLIKTKQTYQDIHNE